MNLCLYVRLAKTEDYIPFYILYLLQNHCHEKVKFVLFLFKENHTYRFKHRFKTLFGMIFYFILFYTLLIQYVGRIKRKYNPLLFFYSVPQI